MQVDQYIHRMLVEEDAKNSAESNELFHASGDAGEKLYKKGDFAKSHIPSLEGYILQKVLKGHLLCILMPAGLTDIIMDTILLGWYVSRHFGT